MSRTSSTSNPTGLIEIDRRHVTLVVTQTGSERYVSVPRLVLDDYGLSSDLAVVVIARGGNTSQRFELGRLGKWDKSPMLLKDLDASAPMRFRLLIHPADSPKLVATCENLRVRDDSQGESLLPMEPANLGEVLWRFENRSDGPVLLFNQEVFPTAGVASAFPTFRPLVMPAALGEVCRILAEQPNVFDDETDPLFGWGPWIDDLGVDRIESDADESEKGAWVDDVVQAFAARHKFATQFKRSMTEPLND